jgi:hypothetical protein
MSRPRQFLLLPLAVGLIVSFSSAAAPPKARVVSGWDGAPAIVIDGRTVAPLFFAGNNQFNRDEAIATGISLAGESDVDLFSFNLSLAWHSSDVEAIETIRKFCAANPEGYYLVRIWIGANSEWLDAHPEECITRADGTRLPYASPSSTLWREAAREQLAQRLQLILDSPFGDRLLGVAPCYLQTGEWFYPETDEFMDYSAANLGAFRRWLKDSYGRAKRLRNAWNTEVSFDTAVFPTPEDRAAADYGVFRHANKRQAAIDMQRFQSALMAETIGYFAKAIKEVTDGRSLVAAFYGYSFELNNNSPRALAHSGHLALRALLDTDEVDIVLAPYAYFARDLGQPGHFHLPIDSVTLHKKLPLMEDDTYTHLAMEPEDERMAPGYGSRTSTMDETLALTRRNYGNFLTHRAGLWYFDLLSDGRWNSKEFWDAKVLLRRMAAELRSRPPFRPQVAFLVSEESVHCLGANTHPLLLETLGNWRAELDRIGTPVGYYLQSDADRLPDSIRLLIFANPYLIDDAAQRSAAKVLERGGTVIYTYAPGICNESGLDPAQIERITGMKVEAHFDNVPFTIDETPGTGIALAESWSPRFSIKKQEGEVLGRYAETGETAIFARPSGGGALVYAAVPRLSATLLREICRRSGIHLYQQHSAMTGVAEQYLIVHTSADAASGAEYQFHWPRPANAVTRLVPYSVFPLSLDEDMRWTDILPPATTAIYRLDEAPSGN